MNETTEKTRAAETAAAIEDEPFGWDSEIEIDEPVRVDLPEGDYNMTVTGLQRASHPGSASIPPCPKARLSLRVHTDAGDTTVYQDLFLTHDWEWKLSRFFMCIGLKKPGERLRMQWDKAEGSRGRVHVAPRTYTGRDGREHTSYNVDFLPWDDKYFPPEPAKLTEIHTGRMADEALPF